MPCVLGVAVGASAICGAVVLVADACVGALVGAGNAVGAGVGVVVQPMANRINASAQTASCRDVRVLITTSKERNLMRERAERFLILAYAREFNKQPHEMYPKSFKRSMTSFSS